KVLFPDQTPPMLLHVDEKIDIMEGLGVEALLLAPFSQELASLEAREFVQKILCKTLKVAGVVVGYNYNFGKGGKGNAQLLAELGQEFGFSVKIVPQVRIRNRDVSSTTIRELLALGQVNKAATLLGYTPFLRGQVVHGEKRGRQLGFPTANLDIPNDLLVPALGVYAVQVELNGRTLPGIANIGVKPTFHPESHPANVEVHIFDFEGDIYGQVIKVSFLQKIRGEKKFNGINELVEQIKTDTGNARAVLDRLGISGTVGHIVEVR
ncbi:MAG TPA: riboflavin biosynthesis protein RibF, partial [Bacillota bacterium]|nr:riboflavin biosynthesis protein RibF [Bacillota bacterium]